jgi:hypothetical protein
MRTASFRRISTGIELCNSIVGHRSLGFPARLRRPILTEVRQRVSGWEARPTNCAVLKLDGHGPRARWPRRVAISSREQPPTLSGITAATPPRWPRGHGVKEAEVGTYRHTGAACNCRLAAAAASPLGKVQHRQYVERARDRAVAPPRHQPTSRRRLRSPSGPWPLPRGTKHLATAWAASPAPRPSAAIRSPGRAQMTKRRTHSAKRSPGSGRPRHAGLHAGLASSCRCGC